MNLFLFSMLCLVLADNFLFCFLGWEGVGLLLLPAGLVLVRAGQAAAAAGKKAFVTNRVGDFGFMIAMFLIFGHFGSLNYTVVLRPLLSGAPGALAAVTASAIGLMLLLGAVGKSAQIPLYIWLPDAMEGPTPVSALIHAATMVTAGVYLMVRIAPILHYAPDVLTTMAIMGAATALFAASIACAQDDIKKVLAYSTISQLGYMFLGIGSGGYAVRPVPHGHPRLLQGPALPRRRVGHPRPARRAGHEAHGRAAQVDADHLRRPSSSAGWPSRGSHPSPASGRRTTVLAAAWHKSPALWAVGFVTAGLTAYYMSRQVALVWFGSPAGRKKPIRPRPRRCRKRRTPSRWPPRRRPWVPGGRTRGA